MGKRVLECDMQPIVYDDLSGWCEGVRHCPSPNFNTRPQEGTLDLVVIHNISLPPKQFGGGYVHAFFCNELDVDVDPYFTEIQALQVSAHFLIERSGECTQFVSCLERAWHAGESQYKGRTNCNDFSIGIELEGADDIPYTMQQYQQLVVLLSALKCKLPSLQTGQITGHEHIAPLRKTDPGSAFDWLRLHTMLRVRG